MSMRKKKLQEGKAIENAIAGLFVVSWWGMVNWLLILATKVTHRNQQGGLLGLLQQLPGGTSKLPELRSTYPEG